VVSKLMARLAAHRVLILLVTAASTLFGLELHSTYSQTGSEQVTAPVVASGDQVVSVKSYGAVGDGVTNDTTAFLKALAACAVGGGMCLVPEGTYLISASGISTGHHSPSVLSRVHLKGANRRASILKIAAMPTDHFLPCEGDNWSVENLTFDMGDYTPLTVGFGAIACRGNNWRVLNCAIVRSGRWGIQAYGGSNWSIEGNYISRTVPGATPPTGAILVTALKGIWSSHGRVVGNVCDGVGITFAGDDGIIARNQVSRSGSGSGIFVQGAPSTHAPTISGNICSDGSSGYDAAQGGRWWLVNGFEVWAADSIICNNIAHDNDGGGFAIGGPNSIVVGNKAYNNGRGRHGYAGFNARINPVRGTSASHSIFIGNFAYDTRYPRSDATQDYGYKEQGDGLRDIKQIGNDYKRNKSGPVKYFGAAQSAAHESGTGQIAISPGMKSKLKALADDVTMPDNVRRLVHGYLGR
jgi:hypothetical protein